MVATQAVFDTLPPAADVPVCDEKGCGKPATLAYRWEWGATGVCCATHAALKQQAAKSLKRAVVVHPIQAAAPAPIGRDERIQLTARALVLEDELKAAQSAGQKTHAHCQDLQVQLSAAKSKQVELKAQLEDVGKRLLDTERQRDELSAQNGELLVEVERLKHLDALIGEREAAAAHERGIEGGNVVDG